MSLEYLEELVEKIDNGREYFTCQGQNVHQWHIANSILELRPKAQRAANLKRYPVNIYRMANGMGNTNCDSFLIAKKIVPTGADQQPHIEWAIVDTRQAAETVRDVTYGPSPFFGLVLEETIKPEKALNRL